MAEAKSELILAQGQYAFIQNETKGSVMVHVGPITVTPTGNDRLVAYDSLSRKFVTCKDAASAAQQFVTAAEGAYIVLENPAADGKHPQVSSSNQPTDLAVGKKVNIPGPKTLALWPGQIATVLEGHQLRSNEYLVARVYSVPEAQENWPKEGLPKLPESLATGQLLVVKGTDVNFFIPPTGVEVLPDPITKNQFIRSAVTLERLEYVILLSEDGNKRYEIGPKVVFPTATEKFVTKSEDGRAGIKQKAIELTDQMGIYVKVIADYTDEIDFKGPNGAELGRRVTTTRDVVKQPSGERGTIQVPAGRYEYRVGDELFITGKQQRIYYPRPEHALIEYDGEDAQGNKFKRQRYYAVAIPEGEARYVLDKTNGKIERVPGPQVFLPDPRHQTIVRRILSDKEVALWYPNNQTALVFNQALRNSAQDASVDFVQDMTHNTMDLERSMNRLTKGSSVMYATSNTSGSGVIMAGAAGETLRRSGKYTAPPSLTLNTKYDGVPVVEPWTGYAVQVVSRTGNRRVVRGPASVLLGYDESLERITLSTGKPKTTDKLLETVYLRVDHNKVSDYITVETKDMVNVLVYVSYRVNFEGDSNKWFSVENYVKFLCDHMRSVLRSKIKHYTIKQFIDESASIIRDTILGESKEGKRPGKLFAENGMRIYDVEVLRISIQDENIAGLLTKTQRTSVEQTLNLAAKESERELATKLTAIEIELADLKKKSGLHVVEVNTELELAQSDQAASRERAARERTVDARTHEVRLAELTSEAETIRLDTDRARATHDLTVLAGETEQYTKRMAAISTDLVKAITVAADNDLAEKLAEAVAPLAVVEQQGIGPILGRLFHGTPIAKMLDKLQN